MDMKPVTDWLAHIDILKTSLAGGGLLAGILVATVFARRIRKPSIVSLAGAEAARGICARLWARVVRFLDAIDYLATRREWRYKQPWMLVLGEQGAGKSSLIASISATWRYRPPAHADQLKADGMQWAYFRHGVLIDSDGKLAAAGEGDEAAAQWAKGLDQLNALRPERPLDGIVLCVSARTLRAANQAQRIALAENVNRQISQLQASVEFMLPAYVVVTQCDDIQGFSSFWKNQGMDRRGDMVGYSAIAQDQTLPPSSWAETAFDQIGARLREVQVDVAALSETIVDVDNFFLFPSHLRNLREPLSHWLETVFLSTAWQSGYLFRGVYFTGSIDAAGTSADGVRSDVNFVDALVSEKALREPALAKVTRQGRWSRNRVIRRVQITAIACVIVMFAALGVAGYRVSKQVDAIVDSLVSLDKAKTIAVDDNSNCPARGDIYPLLEQVAKIDTRSRYVAIPLSWLDGRLTNRSAKKIGQSTVQRVLLPTLSCLLKSRADELLGTASNPLAGDTRESDRLTLSERLDDFRTLIDDIRALETNLKRFEALTENSGSLNEHQLIGTLDALSQYAFGEALPKGVQRSGGVLDDAIRNVPADEQKKLLVALQQRLPNGLHRRLASAIEARSKLVRTAMHDEVAMGSDLLEKLNDGDPPVLDNTRHMGAWLTWVMGSWLGSSDGTNPCNDVVNANASDIKALIGMDAGFSGLEKNTLNQFNKEQCYRQEMNVLREMTLAPYGPMFVPVPGNGGLKLEPRLQSELAGMPALVVLPFMQLVSTGPFECVGGAASWRASEIAEAAGYLEQYKTFVKAQKVPQMPDGGQPLYDRLARQSVAHAIDDALRRAQQVPKDSPEALEAPVRNDTHVAQIGGELALGLKSLQAVLNAYAEYDLADGGAEVRQCARNFAADNLGGVDALAESSRLYSPPVAVGQDAMFSLGSLPVTKDFLARQVARAQVLGGYAKPFLSLLSATTGVDDAWRDTPQTAEFWRNTQQEIDSYTKGKEPTGQVANLDAFFVAQLTGMTYANCASILSAYRAPEYGNDLFSIRRQRLERQVELRCHDQRQAQAEDVYDTLAARFDRDLAGRYPFGEISARDANPAMVRAFFIDYAAQRESIVATLHDMNDARWRSASLFVAQLDKVAAFFASNVAAPEQMQMVGLISDFPADASKSLGADQLVDWRLTVEDRASIFPNGLKALEWLPGETVALNLQWAERSQWRPVTDPTQADLSVEDATAHFDANGPWALLRFIETHRVPGVSESAPILLGFNIPVQTVTAADGGKPKRDKATVFVTWRLTGVDPKTQADSRILLPLDFPRRAGRLDGRPQLRNSRDGSRPRALADRTLETSR